jgi:chromosome segregation ATPase
LEDRLELNRKEEEELSVLKVHFEKSQSQMKQMVEENDKLVSLNNELKAQINELNDKLKEKEGQEDKLHLSNEEISRQKELIERLESDIKSKEALLAEYDKQFDEFEKSNEDNKSTEAGMKQRFRDTEMKIEKLQKEADSVRKENERIEMERAVEEAKINQERLEFKKATSILDKSIFHLTKEKLDLEARLLKEKEKSSINRKATNYEVQTNIAGSHMFSKSLQHDTEAIEKLQSKLMIREEELYKAQIFANNANFELVKLKEKNIGMQCSINKLEANLEEKSKVIHALDEDKKKLTEAISDLMKRRESAKTEITKLTQQIVRQSSRGPGGEDSKRTKISQHISEAVIGSQPQSQGLSFEKELILNTKKELDLLYKELIKSIFSENKEGTYL